VKLRLDTKTFLASAAAVGGVFAVYMMRSRQSTVMLGLLGGVLILGLAIAWIGVLRTRRQIRNRPKPLSFDE
jgi:hypothetical protein